MCKHCCVANYAKRKMVVNVLTFWVCLVFLGATPQVFALSPEGKDFVNGGISAIDRQHEIVFIDPGVPDYELLLPTAGPDAKTVLLNSQSPGLVQIAEALQGRNNLKAIHIVAHGREGQILFKHGPLTIDNLLLYHDAIRTMATAMHPDGDILLYGCNIAKNKQGERFIAAIAQLANRSVAASNDLTGSYNQGGDWQLEMSVGEIVTLTVGKAISASGFDGLLFWSGAQDFAGAVDGGATVTTADGEFVVSTTNGGGINVDANEVYINDSVVSPQTHTIRVATTAAAIPSIFELDSVTFTEYTAGAGRQFSGNIVIVGNNLSGTDPTHSFAASSFPADFRGTVGGHTVNLNGTAFDNVDIKDFTVSFTPNSQVPNEFGLLFFSVTAVSTSNAPTLSNLNGDNRSYNKGDGDVIIDQGAAVGVADTDSADFDGGALTVTISPGVVDASEDILSLDTGGRVSLSGMTSASNVSVDGTVIGTLGNDIAVDTDLVVDLNSNANAAVTAALIGAVTYENLDTINPAPGARTIDFALTDGDGGKSSTASTTVSVNGVGHKNFEGASASGGTVTSADGDFAVSTPNGSGLAHAEYPIYQDEVYIDDSTATSSTQSFTVATTVTASLSTFELDAVAFSEYTAGAVDDFTGNIVIVGNNPSGADPTYSFPASAFPPDFRTHVGGHTVDLNGSAFDNIHIDDFTISYTPNNQEPYELAIINFLVSAISTSDAPTLSNLNGDSLSYDNGDGAVRIDQGTAAGVADADSADFDGGALTVTIGNGTDASEDTLSLDSSGTVSLAGTTSGSSVSVSGTVIGTLANTIAAGADMVVNLNANANAVNAATLIGAVTYHNMDTANPTPGARSVDFILTDGDGGVSSASSATVTVNGPGHQNFEGASGNGTTVTSADGNYEVSTTNGGGMRHYASDDYLDEVYIEDSTATTFTQSLTVATTGAASTFGLDSVTVSEYTTGAGDDFTGDIVIVGNNPSGADPSFSFAASTFPPDFRTQVGGYTVDLTGTGFNGVDIDAFTVSYTPNNQNPNEFAIIAFLVSIGPPNAAPTLSGLDGDSLAYNEDDGAVVVDQGVAVGVVDADSLNFDGGALSVTISAGEDAAEDMLSLDTGGTVSLANTTTGSNVSVGGTVIGTLGGNIAAGADLVVDLNSDSSAAHTATLIGAVTYENTDTGNPTTGARTIGFTLADGDGGTSSTSGATVTVADVNDDPTISSLPTDVTVAEDTAGNIDLTAATLSDLDSGANSIILTLAAGTGVLSASSGGGVTVAGSGTGTLTLTGTVAGVDTFLNTASNIQYTGASDLNGNDSDTLTLVANDGGNTGTGGGGNVVLGTVNVDIVATNDAPIVSGLNGDTPTVTAGGSPAAIDVGADADVTDVDSADFNTGNLTLVQIGGTANGNFSVDGTFVIAGSDGTIAGGETIRCGGVAIGSADAVNDGQGGNDLAISFTVDATPERVVQLIRSLRYGVPSGLGARDFSLSVNDGDGGTSAGAGVSVTATPNTPPTAADGSVTMAVSRSYAFTPGVFNFSDIDGGDTLRQVRVTPLPGAGSLTLSGIVVTDGQAIAIADINAGNLVFTPATGTSGTPYASFGFRVHDGLDFSSAAYTMTMNVYVPQSPPPSGEDDTLNNSDTVPDGSTAVNDGQALENITVDAGGTVTNNGTLNNLDNAGIVIGGTVGGASGNTGTLDAVTIFHGSTLDNRFGTVSDAVNDGTIHGGTLAGTITNNGLITGTSPGGADDPAYALTIASGATVSDGTVAGYIIHRGTMTDVIIGSGTRILISSGIANTGPGRFQGTISVVDDTGRVSTIHIPDGVDFPDVSVVGEAGVEFTFQFLRDYAEAHGWDMAMPTTTVSVLSDAFQGSIAPLPDPYILVDGIVISEAGIVSGAAVTITIPYRAVYIPADYDQSDLIVLCYDVADATWKQISAEQGDDPHFTVTTEMLSAYAVVLHRAQAQEADVLVGAVGGVTSENGGSTTFTLALSRQPTADVIVSLGVSDGAEARVNPVEVIFSPDNHAIPQTITLTGIDDDRVDGDVTYDIIISPVVSADPEYSGLDPTDLIVINTDNEIPHLTAPSDGRTAVELTPVLHMASFGTLDPDFVHTKTRWQVSLDPIFAAEDLVLDLSSAANLETLTIPALVLEKETTYFWRVKAYNAIGNASSWSYTGMFTTVVSDSDDADGNGIPDAQAVPNAEDLDQDGTPDNEQTDIKSVTAAAGDCRIGIKSGVNTIAVYSVTAIDPDSIQETVNRPETLDIGLAGFKILVAEPGDTAEVTIYLSEAVADNAGWYKYSLAKGWQNFTEHVTFGADRKSVTIRLTDGGLGDLDGVVNGIIIDPSGPDALADNVPAPETAGGGGGGCFINAAAQSEVGIGALFRVSFSWLFLGG